MDKTKMSNDNINYAYMTESVIEEAKNSTWYVYAEKSKLYSPFGYQEGKVFIEPSSKERKMGDINSLLKIGMINPLDIDLLFKIGEYHILTKALIAEIFNENNEFSRNSIQKKLKKYHREGLIEVAYVKYSNAIEPSKASGPNFYYLTHATLKYLKKYKNVNFKQINSRDFSNLGNVLSKLSLNQFIINAKKHMSNLEDLEYTNKKFERELIASVKDYNKKIYVLSVKKDQRLDSLIDLVNKRLLNDHKVVLLLENPEHAINLYKNIFDKTDLKSFIFLTDDMTIHSESGFRFTVLSQNNNEFVARDYDFDKIGEV